MSNQDSENLDQNRAAQNTAAENEAAENGPRREESRGRETPVSRFRQQVASKQVDDDDDDSEEDLWSGRYSGKSMVGTWMLVAVASIVLLALAFSIESFSYPIAGILILVTWVVAGTVYLWRRFGYHYQLTTQRFVHKTGIVSQRTDRIEVIDIDDVSFTQGPVQRMFGVGTIHLISSDRSHPELSMPGIAKVSEVAGLIDDVRRKERRRRSLHIEAI